MRPKARQVRFEGKGERKLPAISRPAASKRQLPRILTLDIETAPIEALVWRIFDENIGLDQIQKDCTILSFGAKWLHNPKMIYRDTSGRGIEKVRDDKPIMQPLWDLLDEADIVVAQNGQAFDIKTINARMLIHGMRPYSPIKQVDTFLTAKRLFRFTSNKLEWQAQVLTDTKKSKHHKFPGIELWLECLKDNPEAWKEMKHYNLLDVIACEKVYLKQLAWNDKHPNVGTYNWSLETTCPRCGSVNVEAAGYRTLQVGIYVQYKCNDCGAWSRGKEQMTSSDTRKVKLTS